MCRVPFECSAEYWSVHTIKENKEGMGKNNPKGLEEIITQTHTELVIVHFEQSRKPNNHGA